MKTILLWIWIKMILCKKILVKKSIKVSKFEKTHEIESNRRKLTKFTNLKNKKSEIINKS